MVVTEDVSGVNVVFYKTHFGHGSNLGRCRLTKEERMKISGKIFEGVNFDRILDDIRDNVENILDVATMPNTRDFFNIQREYDSISARHHQSNYVSVKLWVEKMKAVQTSKNPIVFSEFSEECFFLIITTEFQLEMLAQFEPNKICLDTTHGTNEYNIHLTTIVVVDEFGNSYPCAFCFSQKKNIETWVIF